MSVADLLYEFTEWIRTTPVVELALWISNQPASNLIGSRFLTIPIIQTMHILALATAFGSVLMTNLRILGLAGAGQTLEATIRRYQPWTWGALVVLLFSGAALIVGEPVRELVNPIFWIKMALIVALILASLLFHVAVRRTMPGWGVAPAGSAAVRGGAVALILLWCLIMVAGRWIAYAPT